jgi:hypothetical protein
VDPKTAMVLALSASAPRGAAALRAVLRTAAY